MKNGEIDNNGIIYLNEKKYYEGSIENNKPNGIGKLYDQEENIIYYGEIENGLPHGYGASFFMNQETYRGNWFKGKRKN